jgi:glycosyltransferase involved in cell wall biosynthesis
VRARGDVVRLTQYKPANGRLLDEAPILVTVLIVTYNHQPYIAAAIDSALVQKTSFPIEILISEDASTDGTREIVQRFAAANPDRVTAIHSEQNVRSNEVVARGLRRARGRYVALLDGDDLWTSRTKLQDQADYLEAHPGIAAVFHNAAVAMGEDITVDRWTRADQKPELTLEDIWQGNPFATCAGMMRTACVRDVPSWYADFFPITDWPLYVLCAKAGDLAFVNEVVGVYRLHGAGLFSALPDRSKLDAIEGFYRRMISVLEPSDALSARGGYSRYFFDWSKRSLADGDLASARSCFRRSLRGGGVGRTVSRREALQLGLQLFRATAVPA